MTRVDQFESVFKAAAKTLYRREPVPIRSVLLLTDLDPEPAGAFADRVRSFLDLGNGETAWKVVPGGDFGTVARMLEIVRDAAPDLIGTYRSLHSGAWRWTTTLGRYVDVLAQETAAPILVLPNPHAERDAPQSFPHGRPTWGEAGTRTVMAITDHLAGDHRLVSLAVRFTRAGGRLILAHVEDGTVFDRYLEVISKIPAIDTEEAREAVRRQLLKEPRDHIRSCAGALRQHDPELEVVEAVIVGHRLSEYRRLVQEHAIDLLVLNTKDEDQLAMHGRAYPLVVELRHVPILML
ncbi:MAG: hypothetical protein ACE5JG_06490 [Planctomycetota bacterium]